MPDPNDGGAPRVDESVIELISDLATGIWRIKRRLDQHLGGKDDDDLRGVYRHVEASCDLLGKHQIEVRDNVGQKYVAGMAVKVLAFQSSEDVSEDTIIETVRPSVFFNETLIQRAEVIVAIPQLAEDEDRETAVVENTAGKSENDASPDSPEVEPSPCADDATSETTTAKDQGDG